MNENNEIAVLIVLYRNVDILKYLLTSLQEQTFNKFKIFAIENDFKQESIQLLNEIFPEANCFPFQSNLGYAPGNNFLANKAIKSGFRYLFIVNPDVILEKNCMEMLYHEINLDKNTAIAGPLVLRGSPNNSPGIQCFELKADFWSGKTRSIMMGTPLNVTVNMVSGCAFLIKSEAVEKCGLFNEENFMYGDEIDLAYRLFLKGYTGVITRESIVWHNNERKIIKKESLLFEYYYKTRNRILFLKRYNKYFSLLFDMIGEILISPLRIRWLLKLADKRMVKFYYKGYLNGLIGKKGQVKLRL